MSPDKKIGLAGSKPSSKYLFISFSSTKWDGPWYVRQKLMSEISKDHKVIYVNQRIELREIINNILKIRNWNLGIRKIGSNLLLIESPWIFPRIYKLKILDTIIEWLYHAFIRLIAFLFSKDCVKILYIWEPDFFSVTKYYRDYKYIYHPYDLFEKYTYAPPKKEKFDLNVSLSDGKVQDVNNEKELVKNAFLFYSVSELLCEHYYNKFGRRPKLLTNAVHDIYFKDNNHELKEKALNILTDSNKKRIGFSGGLKGSLDLDIIINASAYLKDYDFYFIGPLRYSNIKEYDDKLERLLSLKNVVHIGPFQVEILTYLLRRMDILLMIYSNDKSIYTHYSGPAKLFEYMAIGKPIISTPHPAISEYKKYITIVEDSKQFIAAVQNSAIYPDKQLEIIQLAKENTWEKRKKDILEDIQLGLCKS